MQSRVRIRPDRHVEDPSGIELEVLAFGHETGAGQLERISVAHEVAVIRELVV